MKTKLANAKRYATAVIAVADRASGAWTVWVAANAVIVWSAQLFFSAPAMTAANDNTVQPVVASASTLMPPRPQATVAAEPPAQRFDLSALPAPEASGDPAKAVWRYLCGRDAALGAAADAPCGTSAALNLSAPEQGGAFEEPPRRTDPFAWVEQLNAANDNHHLVEE
jgi:hypothetical protein